MGFVSRHLCVSALGWMCALVLFAVPAFGTESVAVEIVAADLPAGEPDTSGMSTTATEVTPLEWLSFRDAGTAVERLFPTPAATAAAGWLSELEAEVQAKCDAAATVIAEAEMALNVVGEDPHAASQVREHYTVQLEGARQELLGVDETLRGELAAERDEADGALAALTGWCQDVDRLIGRVDECLLALIVTEPILANETKAYFDFGRSPEDNRAFSERYAREDTRYFAGADSTPSSVAPAQDNRWEIDGEVSVGTGHATYADQEYQEFALSETLTTARGHEYEFYQEYEVDHSYVNGGLFTVGAEQRLLDLLWNGELRLTEEFSQYRDRNDSLNDRQEGRFRLRFDPQWCDERWRADLDYKYKVRAYETFSERSYILHQARVQLEHEFCDQLTGGIEARLADYNYSIGSTRSNSRLGLSTSWEWEPCDRLRIAAGVGHDEKTYAVRRARSYERYRYEGSVRWQPDGASSVELKGELTDYDREYQPSRNYEDTRLEFRVRRDLTSQLEVDARVIERRKEYDIDPLNDMDQHGLSIGANFNPCRQWNFYSRLDRTDYEYARSIRAFTQERANLGACYRNGGLSALIDWRRTENNYQAATDRDYSREDLDLDVDCRFGEQRVRVYYGIGQLEQAHPTSVNEYTETRLGAEWRFEFDPQAEFRLSYVFR